MKSRRPSSPPNRSSAWVCRFSLMVSLIGVAQSFGSSARSAEAPAAPASADCGTENMLASKSPSNQMGVRGPLALVTDEAAPPDGAVWDAPAAVQLDGGPGQITYDLGRPRVIGALVLQADANDMYRISVSTDDAPGSYKLLGEVANVVDRGPGLRTRSMRLMPVTARYVRVMAGEGDGFFSISELAVYCRAPTPFPPAFRAVVAPLAQAAPPGAGAGADDRRAAAVDKKREESSGRWGLLLFAAVLVVFGAGHWFRKRVARAAAGGGGKLGWTSHDWLRVAFAASGCAALIYEIVWFHLLRLVIGASALSVGIVLASFMGGMFLGSLLFARFVPRDSNALRVYAFLEIGIGVFGLLMPLLLPAVQLVYVGLVGYGSLGIVLRGVIAAVLLLPPTALMGATLPVVARRYPHGRRGMSGLASLYAANTVGAVVGCLVCGFYLLAVWDVWVATVTAAALNFLVGWFALRHGRKEPPVRGDVAPPSPVAVASPVPSPTAAAASPSVPSPSLPGLAESQVATAVYIAVGLSGFTALGAQVVWTRLLTLLFGATVYAFAIILAVFLAGLGVGSAAAAYWLRRGQNAVRGLAWSQIALVPAILLAAYLLADVLPYGSPPAATPISALHALHVLRAVAVIFPAAALWGMSFPFGLAAAAPRGGDTGASSGRIYASNTLGAIVGALAISFWAVPSFGTRWAEQSLVIAAGLSAGLLLWVLRGAGGWFSPAWAVAAGMLAAAVLPGPSTVFLAHGRYIWWVDPRDQYPFVSEGAASTVAVHVGPDGFRNFHVSGRVEATNNPADLRLERMLGHLSALAHPAPASVLVVGLGGGVTAGALAQHPEVKRVVICEIEPRVIGAANEFAHENYNVLKDPKVQVVFDDARHFLATTREKFDIITSDPIHPWVRGNSVLFSREYYAVVKSKLKPGGIATQWVPLYETSEEAIRIQMKTFMDAFPQGSVWNSAANKKGYDVVLVGPSQPLRLDLLAIQARIDRSPGIAESLREVRMVSAVDLFATYGASAADMKKWYATTPLNRDFSLKLEYISGLALNANEADDIYAHMVEARTYPADIFVAPAELATELRERIQRPGGK